MLRLLPEEELLEASDRIEERLDGRDEGGDPGERKPLPAGEVVGTNASCNSEVSSEIESVGGKGSIDGFLGQPLDSDIASKLSWEDDGETGGVWIRLCAKLGMVAMRGESAQGLVGDERSWSRVGSTNFINLSAAPEPHGNFRGRSKVFPKRMSSAE